MTATIERIRLTDEQEVAVEYIARHDRMVTTLGGFAGTGKTTVIRTIVERLPRFAVCAYTGKAANVLRRKGMGSASTIHSLVYKPHDVGGGQVEWELRSPHELCLDGFVVDEASMVGKGIHEDLLTFEVPIVYVGDHGQLEPVGDRGFNLMERPDVTLEQIHRNAGVIARFAEHLRKGGGAGDWDCERENSVEGEQGEVRIIHGPQLRDCLDIDQDTQMICAYNRTRNQYNGLVRQFLELPAGEPVAGDRVMCLENSREFGVFNGMQGRIERIDGRRLWLDSGQCVPYVRSAFGAEKKPERVHGRVPFDWAYCVTAHKFQGDEADNVLVLEQRCDLWSHSRWAYTCASRARKRLTWVLE